MRVVSAAGLIAVLGVSLAGQSSPPSARFEVADVRVSVPNPNITPALNSVVRIGTPRNGRYEIRRATMVDLVRTAYGIDADKVVGGPHWLELDRFDLVAKVPPGTNRESLQPMLQALLADRFGLSVRQEMTPVAAQALVRGDGELRLKEAPAGAGTCTPSLQPTQGSNFSSLQMTFACRGLSMAGVAEQLGRLGVSMTGLTGPIVDATALPGAWDVDLRWTPHALVATTGGTSFASALTQAGLKLEARSVPLPTITVESVNRTPTANDAAAVAAAFPPGPPPEFEVAEIKPSAPGARISRQTLPNGQINFTAVPLRTLITQAWLVPADRISGPRTLDNTFDVIAKVSVGVVDPQQIDPEVLGPMLQTLLTDRLQLKVRFEEREVRGYSLVSDGAHKLTKADPATRTRCASPPPTATPTVSAGGPSQTLVCQNITMSEFSDQLLRIGGGFFQVPVLDETKLEGRWNFTISFSPPGLAQALANARALSPGAIAGGGAAGTASDPTGVMTLEEAIDRQMGLKLRARQRQGRLLVVDYVEDTPAANN